MANSYIIDTIFRIVDGASKPLQRIGVSADAVSSQFNKDVAKSKMKLAEAGNAIKGFGKMALGVATGAIAAGAAVATKQYIEFDDALHGAGAAFSDFANLPVDEFSQKLDEVGQAARAVAAATEFDAVQASNALTSLARAGVKSANAVALLPGVADLATAAAVGLDDAVSMAVGGLNTLGLMSDDPAKLADNMKYISDIMAYTANSANMSLTDVSEAIKIGGIGFTKANQSIEDMSASITALASRGYVGAEAGNALKNMITKLSAPVPKAVDSLEALGIVTKDQDGNLLNFIDIVGQFEEATRGMGDAEIAAHLKNIFGLENINQFQALLSVGKNGLLQYADAASNASGSAANMANVMRMSLSNQIEVLKSGLTELGFKFVEAFKDKGSQGLQTLITMIQNFDPQPVIDFLIKVVDKFISIVQFLWSIKEVILTVVAGIMAYKAAIMAVAIAQTIYETATKLAAAEQGILNAVMSANPIGLIITAVTALIAVVILLVTHWQDVVNVLTTVWDAIKNFAAFLIDGFINAMKSAWEWIGNMAQKFGFLLGPMGLVISAIKELTDNWGAVTNAFQNGGILNGIKAIGLSLLNGVLAPVQSLLEMLSNIPGLGNLAGLGAEKLAELRSNLQSSIDSSAPVTNRDATVLSREESVTTSNINVNLSRGLTGTVSGTAPNVTVRTQRSGMYAAAM